MAFLVCTARSCAWPSAATILFKFSSSNFLSRLPDGLGARQELSGDNSSRRGAQIR